MKRKIFSLAIIAVSIIASSTAFAAPGRHNSKDNRKGRECRVENKCCKDSLGKKALNPFEGLNLTADQQAKIEQLNKTRVDGRKDCSKGKNKLDTISPQQKMDKKADGRREMSQKRSLYLKEIKQILTPEQYVQFLENSYVNKGDKMFGKKSNRPGDKDKTRDTKRDKK